MKYSSTGRAPASGSKVVYLLSVLAAACMVGTLGYMILNGDTRPAPPVVGPSSSAAIDDSASADDSAVTEPQKTPQQIAAETYTDSPYRVANMPVLVNHSHKIADGLEEQMMAGEDTFKRPNGIGTYWIHGDAAEALAAMLSDAQKAGFTLSIGERGGFRTYARQQEIYDALAANARQNGKTEDEIKEMAKKANALPGYCENELGTAVDFTPSDASFASTGAYGWLVEHCTDYGFILRFPADKEGVTGVTAQPYHFRFVGINHAKAMQEANLCLEEYVG